MDTSKEYIEMCLGAKEIQTKYEEGYENGDYYHVPSDNTTAQVCVSGEKAKLFYTIVYNIWLPRQDQLQSMLSVTTTEKHRYYCKFAASILNLDNWSFEMIWLHIVMKYQFTKIWSPFTKKWCRIIPTENIN